MTLYVALFTPALLVTMLTCWPHQAGVDLQSVLCGVGTLEALVSYVHGLGSLLIGSKGPSIGTWSYIGGSGTDNAFKKKANARNSPDPASWNGVVRVELSRSDEVFPLRQG